MSKGSRIKERRLQLGLTQEQLGELLGVSKGAVGNYESGVSSPKEEIMLRMFDSMQIDPNYLYQDIVNISEDKKISATPKSVALTKINEVLDELNDDEIDKLFDYVSFLLWLRGQP